MSPQRSDKLVPISREFLRAFYSNHPLEPVPADELAVHTLGLKGLHKSLQLHLPVGVSAVDPVPLPSKIDDALWRSRQLCEEAASSLSCVGARTAGQDCKDASAQCCTALLSACAQVLAVQEANTNAVKLQLARFIPADFRGTMVKKAQEVKEAKNKKAVDDLMRKGGSIRAMYELFLQQQWERRQSLVELGHASGMYRFLIKYLGGVPQILLDFAKEINAKLGPMEEQRLKYGPDLYAITSLGIQINCLAALWAQDPACLASHADSMRKVVLPAVMLYVQHMTRIVTFIGRVFTISPFFVTAEQLVQCEGEGEADTVADDCSTSTSTSESMTALVEVLQVGKGGTAKSSSHQEVTLQSSHHDAQACAAAHTTQSLAVFDQSTVACSTAAGLCSCLSCARKAAGTACAGGTSPLPAAGHVAAATSPVAVLPSLPDAEKLPHTTQSSAPACTHFAMPTTAEALPLPSTTRSRSMERGSYSARPSSNGGSAILPPILAAPATVHCLSNKPKRNSHTGSHAVSSHSNRPSSSGHGTHPSSANAGAGSGSGGKAERSSHAGVSSSARPSATGSYWSAHDQQEWDEEAEMEGGGGSPGSGMLSACLPGWQGLATLSGGGHRGGPGGEVTGAEALRPIGE